MTQSATRYDVETGFVAPLDAIRVYRSAPYRGFETNDATNGGASARYDELFLFASEVTIDQVDPRQRAQAFQVQIRIIGDPVVSLVPMHWPAGTVGPMFGGNFGHAYGALRDEIKRLGGGQFYGAVAIHDRYETVEQYNMNFD